MPERWSILPEGANEQKQTSFSEILAVHAALLPDGKVLYFGGSQHIYDDTLRSVNDPRLDNTRLWDPQTGGVVRIPSPFPLYDLFCCGHAFLADGRLLVAGGASGYPPANTDHHAAHYRGTRRTAIFDCRFRVGTNPWHSTPDLNVYPEHTQATVINTDRTHGSGGRWYPMLVTLGDRHVVVFAGHPQEEDVRHSNYSVEVFDPGASPSGAFVPVGDEPQAAIQAIARLRFPEVYPRAHLLPNGRVFVACLADGNSYSWDPYRRSPPPEQAWQLIAPFRAGNATVDPDIWSTTYFDNGALGYNRSFFSWSSVLLPLLPEEGYNARVLMVGRAQPYVIDLGRRNDPWPPQTQWEPTAPRNASEPLFMPSLHRPVPLPNDHPGDGRGDTIAANHRGMRQQCLPVLMPDATVLVVGGSTTSPSDSPGYGFDAVALPEVYTPGPSREEPAPTTPETQGRPETQGSWRTLHTPARVPRVYHGVALLLPDGRVWTAGSNALANGQIGDRELRMEVFEPWYFDRTRPEIGSTPVGVRHGQPFDVTLLGGNVLRVALIRVGSVTHSFNSDQRYVGLRFEQVVTNELRIFAPPDAWVAPPGYYLLFVIDSAGVPSIGRFLRVSLAWEPWFALGPDVFPRDAAVTAVSTRPGGTSLFVVKDEGNGEGRVFSKFFPDPQHAGQWSGWFPLGDNRFRPGSKITALSLSEGATSLYVMGLDGKVWSNFFPHDGRPEWSGWFDLGPNVFPADATVTAVSTRPGGTSLYVVGLDEGNRGERVWSRFFPDPRHPGQWSNWFPIGDNVFRPGSTVTALTLSEGATSLYVMGLDGKVWSNFFPRHGRPEWSGWFDLGPNVFPQNATVAAVSTRPGGTSLFVVGLDEGHGNGRVWSKFFPDPQHPNQWSDWFPIGDNVFRPGSTITAVSLSEGATSLYVMGLDGKVWSNFFPHNGHPEWSGWFDLGPNVFPPEATVTAVSTRPGGTSLYVVGLDRQVWSTFFDPRDPVS